MDLSASLIFTFTLRKVSLVLMWSLPLRDMHTKPLAFLSIVRWFETQENLSLETYLRHPLADKEFRGHGVVILFLLRTFCRPTVLSDVLKFHGAVPEWADMKARIVGRIEGKEVAVNVLENPPRYPSLGVVYYAKTIEDRQSVLVPAHLSGPDAIIKCCDGLHLMGQTKSFLEGNLTRLGFAICGSESYISDAPKQARNRPDLNAPVIQAGIYYYTISDCESFFGIPGPLSPLCWADRIEAGKQNGSSRRKMVDSSYVEGSDL